MRRKLVAGNWKMNGTLATIRELLGGVKAGAGEITAADIAVCVPYPYLSEVATQLTGSNVAWGAQNLSEQDSGAYTGEVAASMLNDFNCQYAIVGHSERRTIYGEDDALVASKVAVARKAGLTPILCIGETLEERESAVTEQVVARQLDAVINSGGIEAIADSVIAYEPVWAIGTGKTASPEQAQEVHAFIRSRLAVHSKEVAAATVILYGGSMNAANAEQLLAMEDIDGGLIGGASLKSADFLTICRAANG